MRTRGGWEEVRNGTGKKRQMLLKLIQIFFLGVIFCFFSMFWGGFSQISTLVLSHHYAIMPLMIKLYKEDQLN
jgi:hypothetical protein